MKGLCHLLGASDRREVGHSAKHCQTQREADHFRAQEPLASVKLVARLGVVSTSKVSIVLGDFGSDSQELQEQSGAAEAAAVAPQ